MNKLPDKPSELIRLALDDLEKAEKSPTYEVNMDRWHTQEEDGICHVCLAGSVMAFSLDVPAEQTIDLTDWIKKDPEIASKLIALDYLRIDAFTEAFSKMDIEPTLKQIEVLNEWRKSRGLYYGYIHGPSEFKKQRMDLADKLEEIGL